MYIKVRNQLPNLWKKPDNTKAIYIFKSKL